MLYFPLGVVVAVFIVITVPSRVCRLLVPVFGVNVAPFGRFGMLIVTVSDG